LNRRAKLAIAEKIDLTWLRKIALNFERRISKNAELRAKFEDEPQKYVVDLSTSVGLT
jgi:beta-catenin-like protein 1